MKYLSFVIFLNDRDIFDVIDFKWLSLSTKKVLLAIISASFSNFDANRFLITLKSIKVIILLQYQYTNIKYVYMYLSYKTNFQLFLHKNQYTKIK